MKFRAYMAMILAAAVTVLTMTGASHTDGAYSEIAECGSASLLVFDADGTASNIVLAGDSPCYVRISGDGSVESGFSLPNDPLSAHIYGESLYTYSSVRGRVLMNEFDLNDGAILNSFYIKTTPDLLQFISGDASGNTYYVKKDEASVVYRCGPDGISAPWVEAGGEISYCGVTDDALIYYCNGEILPVPVYGEPAPAGIPSQYIPAKFFSPGYMVDISGVICRVASSAEPVYESGISNGDWLLNPRNVLLHAMDENDCFYIGTTDPSVIKTDGSGALSDSYGAKPNIIGVNANGLLINDLGSIQFAAYDSFAVAAEPTPDVLPEDVEVSGDYLIVTAGKTVHELGTQLKTSVFLDGAPVTTGSCVTGMRLVLNEDDYTLIILGDVNGTGTVNSADIKAVQCHLVGSELLEEPYLFAADYSQNGSVGTEDLALMAKAAP